MYLAAASYELGRAHRALGALTACRSLNEFVAALDEFLASARKVLSWIAKIGVNPEARGDTMDMTTIDRARSATFAAWFESACSPAMSHTLNMQDEILVSERMTGSTQPAKADDFYLEHDPSRSALSLCAEFLQRATVLYEQARNEVRRLGLFNQLEGSPADDLR